MFFLISNNWELVLTKILLRFFFLVYNEYVRANNKYFHQICLSSVGWNNVKMAQESVRIPHTLGYVEFIPSIVALNIVKTLKRELNQKIFVT